MSNLKKQDYIESFFIVLKIPFFPIYFIYKQIWPSNGHKMAKNALDELILGPDVYSYGFYQFTERILN